MTGRFGSRSIVLPFVPWPTRRGGLKVDGRSLVGLSFAASYMTAGSKSSESGKSDKWPTSFSQWDIPVRRLSAPVTSS